MFSVPRRYIYISYLVFHTVLTAAACFSPSADNYLSRLGFVTAPCFLLATLSADNAPQILDRCRGVCSGDAVRGIITALFSSPPNPTPHPRPKKNKQTHSLPWHRVRLPSQHCVVVLRGAAQRRSCSQEPIMIYVESREPRCPSSC